MNAMRLVIATLLAATAFPLLAAQPQPTNANDAASQVQAPEHDAGAAQAQEDRWTAPVSPPPVGFSADRAGAVLDPEPKRPALTFADQQPLKPNMFDSPTAWEDEP